MSVGFLRKWVQAASAVCTFALLMPIAVRGQPDSLWSNVYGTEEPEDCRTAIQTSAGEFVMAGYYVNPFPDRTYDFEIVKADAEGNRIWQRRYGRRFRGGNRTDEFAECVVERSDGSYMIGGWANIINDGDTEGMILTVSADGDSLWSRRFGGERITELFEQPDGGFVAAGRYRPYFWLFKADSSGEKEWEHIYDLQRITQSNHAIRTSDGGYLLIGTGANSMMALKADSIGELEWIQSYRPDTLATYGKSLSRCFDGGYILTGLSQGRNQMGYSVRISEEGELIWDRVYGRSIFWSTAQVEGGGFVYAGESPGNRQGRDAGFYLVRSNSAGEPLWETAYGDIGDRASSVMVTSDGGYALAGKTSSINRNRENDRLANDNFWIVRTGPDPVNNSVVLLDPAFPSLIALDVPYPNPFNSQLTIRYASGWEARPARLSIHDLQGRVVADLSSVISAKSLSSTGTGTGIQSVTWEASGVPAGVYVVRLETGSEIRTIKTLLLR